MTNEEIISDYLRVAYTDERLAMLLAHAEDGKLSFNSCCCLIGVTTVDHALTGYQEPCPQGRAYGDATHLTMARGREGSPGDVAEDAFCDLGDNDARRRERIIPLIKAEMERRERQRSESSSPVDLQAVSV